MINIEEIFPANIDKYDIIDPFTFKYTKLSLRSNFNLTFNINIDSYPIKYKTEYNNYFSISIFNYIKILDKIFDNEKSKICYLCKKLDNNNLYLCCNLCHEWFCDSCSKLHKEEDPIHIENIKKFNIRNVYNELNTHFKMRFLKLKNIQKNWKICECDNGGGPVICYCPHGLRCKNCKYSLERLCPMCDNDYDASNFRFFYLDLEFLITEINNYRINEDIEDIKFKLKDFNDNISKIFLENINKIENTARKKRFKKHFYDLRNNFIAYYKLKLIVIKVLQKTQNYNLYQLFKTQKYHKLVIKKYKYDKNFTEDENISKILNFFATKKPIFLVKKIKKEKPYLINQYLLQTKQQKNKYGNKFPKKCKLSEGYFYHYFEDENEFKAFANNKKLFDFFKKGNNINRFIDLINNNIDYNNNNQEIIYSIKFKDDFDNIKYKRDILFNPIGEIIISKPFIKLKNNDWVFHILSNDDIHNSFTINFICFLKQDIVNEKIFILKHAFNFEQLNTIFYIKRDNKILLYKKEKNYYWHKGRNKIAILDLFYPYNIKYKTFPDVILDDFFYLKNYKNIILISCYKPLLCLMIFDYEINQVNTVIEIINPIIPKNAFYDFAPYIYDIQELKNDKLLLYGSQTYERNYPLFSKKYNFEIIFDFKDFKIDLAENKIIYEEMEY